MSPELWLIFISASIPIHLAPGPNNILALTHSARYGFTQGFLGSFARYPAYLTFFLISGIGLGAVLATSVTYFIILKWIGAGYLIWLGIQMMRSATPSGETHKNNHNIALKTLWHREFLASVTNPKAILYATAFYAQFINPTSESYATQFIQMVTVSMTLEMIAAATYAISGSHIGVVVKKYNILHWFLKLSGLSLITAGILLAFSNHPQESKQ